MCLMDTDFQSLNQTFSNHWDQILKQVFRRAEKGKMIPKAKTIKVKTLRRKKYRIKQSMLLEGGDDVDQVPTSI